MSTETVGDLTRAWRKRRGISQLGLALDADVSARHLSFVESGRASASRELLLRLGEQLTMPLRDRNRLLVAGGYAPVFNARSLDDPDMAPALAAISAVLDASAPYPALVVDPLWNLVRANQPAQKLLEGLPNRLTTPPVNVLRATLDPEGLAPRIANLPEWRHHLLARLRADFTASGNAGLLTLHDELAAIPVPASKAPPAHMARIAVPLMLGVPGGPVLSLISTTTVFGTANDITLAELTLESFFPADASTRDFFLAHG
ncbi:MAG: transcriptional regulator [Bordetella sp. SCN 67-23]|nr:helix-turn-helix transcriptional regulator [Burkholderiales bacterium]ODS69931.1 MAG: transcriptional regulator [Bordetella sp. SCN 67-23]ODU62920.1 MAG: transcriptional regulator [Bordetella sp. SCN 68-11]OJW93434.1 MAG: transcriptional regulator [Burkholderiales bacterium 67-32]